MWWAWLLGLPAGLVVLLLAALGVLMAAQRAKAWWVSRGEDDYDSDGTLSQKVVDRRFRALMKAHNMPLYRRPRLGAGRRPS